MFLKTEAHRCRHGRMKMSVIHVRPRIQTTTVHLIVSVIPLHDFIIFLDLLFNVWKFALQVLAALLLFEKRRVLEERRDTKSTVSDRVTYFINDSQLSDFHAHIKSTINYTGKEHITSNFRIFYAGYGIENNRRVKDAHFSSSDSPEGFGWFDPPPTHRGEKDGVKASAAGWSSEGMWRVEGKFTGRQEEQTQLGKCGAAEEQKECKNQESMSLRSWRFLVRIYCPAGKAIKQHPLKLDIIQNDELLDWRSPQSQFVPTFPVIQHATGST